MTTKIAPSEFWARAEFPHDQAGNLLVSSAMPRADYEAECTRTGIVALSDDEISQRDRRGWYGYGYSLPQFEYSEETLVLYLRSILDSARSWGIKVEARRYTVEGQYAPGAKYTPVQRASVAATMPDTWATCNFCGMSVQRSMLMTSPKGSVCPDCYDEAEA